MDRSSFLFLSHVVTLYFIRSIAVTAVFFIPGGHLLCWSSLFSPVAALFSLCSLPFAAVFFVLPVISSAYLMFSLSVAAAFSPIDVYSLSVAGVFSKSLQGCVAFPSVSFLLSFELFHSPASVLFRLFQLIPSFFFSSFLPVFTHVSYLFPSFLFSLYSFLLFFSVLLLYPFSLIFFPFLPSSSLSPCRQTPM